MKPFYWSQFCTWLGWIAGVLLIDKPWKSPPVLKSWISLHNLYAVLITVFHYSVFLDIAFHSFDRLVGHRKSNNDLKKSIIEVLFIFSVFMAACKRLYIWIYAKRAAQFNQRLELQQAFFGNPEDIVKYGTWKITLLATLMFLVRLSVATLRLILKVKHGGFKNTWLEDFGSEIQITLYAVTMFGIYLPLFIITGSVLTTTLHLIKVLDDFCDQLEFTQRDKVFDFRGIPIPITDLQCEGNVSKKAGNGSIQPEIYLYCQEKLVNRMQDVKALFEEYDCVYGPMLLSLIVTSFVGVLNGTNAIFVENKASLRFAAALLEIISESFVLLFMEMGHRAQLRVSLCSIQ